MRPLDPGCACYVCGTYTRAYLRHLFKAKEIAALSYFSYHNLHFMLEIMAVIRKSLAEGRFTEAKREFFEAYLPSGKLKEAA